MRSLHVAAAAIRCRISGSQQSLGSATVLTIALLGLACGRRDLGYFRIQERLTAGVVEEPGLVEVTAQCREGEQLVGGGYSLSSTTLFGAPQDPADPLVVVASFPSDPPQSWTVRVFNPDEDSDGPNSGTVVFAESYCVVADHFPLRMERVRSDLTEASFIGLTELTAACPGSSTLTAGGFETVPTVPWAGLYNAWSIGFTPTLDPQGVANGWRLTQSLIEWTGTLPDVPAPRSRVHALCASQNLDGGEAVSEPLTPTDPVNFGYYEGEVACPREQFTVGGGYEFSGNALIPHHVLQTQAVDDFGRWRVEAIYGHETGAQGDVEAWAACIQAPQAEFVVHITSPADHATISASSGGGGQTDPVTFTAVAVDEQASVVSGVTFEWTDNGASLGAGSNISAPLTAQTCAQGDGFIRHEITVTGTDGSGNTSTDTITVLAGQVC
jgi:hypothetical protein